MSVSQFTDKEFKTKKLTENSSKNEYLKTEIKQGRTYAQVAVNELSVSRDQFTDEEFKIKQSTEYSSRGEYVSENKTEPNRDRLPTESLQKKLSILFEELRQILESDEFDDGLRKYLHESNPDYLRKIEKCRKDLLKEDHGIVVAGETSAGKSTLINKLLQKRIFKGRNRESTSTICKIRNSEDIRIITERLNGETQIIPLQCSIETENVEKILRDTLKKLTDLTSSKDSKDFRSVDVGFPIPFLKGNTIIVDTPGIGGSGDVSKKVMEYLPYAVSFIFVVDVGSAGGMQNDRLPEILRSIIHLQLEDEMPCFDPKDVIFITNKWDTIARDGDSDEDSSDEDQEEKTWRELKQDIKNIWPSVKEENIFKMNLKHVYSKKMTASTVASTKEFENFQHSLKRIITGNENKRLLHHLRFVDGLLKNIMKGINSGLALSKRCVEEQKALTKEHQAKIKDLKRKWKEGERKLLDEIQKIIKNEAQRLLNYMSTDVGKEAILNPPEQKSITEIRYIPILFSKEIRKRIEMYVQSVLHSERIQEIFLNLRKRAFNFYSEVSLQISEMENDWTDHFEDAFDPSAEVGSIMALQLVLAFFSFGFHPICAILGLKQKVIDEEYKNSLLTIKSTICRHLQAMYGDMLEKLIKKISNEILPRKIRSLENMIQDMSENRQRILANRFTLLCLSKDVSFIKETKLEIQKSIR